MAKMLGQDLFTQPEFDAFYNAQFRPLADLQKSTAILLADTKVEIASALLFAKISLCVSAVSLIILAVTLLH